MHAKRTQPFATFAHLQLLVVLRFLSEFAPLVLQLRCIVGLMFLLSTVRMSSPRSRPKTFLSSGGVCVYCFIQERLILPAYLPLQLFWLKPSELRIAQLCHKSGTL